MSGLLTRSLVCWVTHTQPMTYPSKWQGQACWHSQPLQGWGRKDLAEEHLPGVYEVLGLVPSTTDLKLGVQSQRGFISSLPVCTTLQPCSQFLACFFELSPSQIIFSILWPYRAKRYCFHLGFYSFLCLFVLRQGLTILLSWVSDFWPLSNFSTLPPFWGWNYGQTQCFKNLLVISTATHIIFS